jgi:hypothetical protein
MSRKTFLRSTAIAASAALVAGIGLMSVASPAQAAVVGGATLSPSAGGVTTAISITTDGPCAAPATRVRVRINGFGLEGTGTGINGVSPTAIGFSTTGPMTLPLEQAFVVYANNNSTYLDGDYTVTVQCLNNLGTVIYDEYRNKMTWTTPGNTVANLSAATYTSVTDGPAVAAVPTTTTLSADPAGSSVFGSSVDLTATVDGGATDPNAGSVEFFDGAVSLGTASVSGGVATLSTIALPAGARSLTAVFSGSSGFDPSTSSSVSYQVNAVATTTVLAVNGVPEQFQQITLDATVVPNNAVGSIVFKDGATTLATRPLVSGTAQYQTNGLALGTRLLTAEFVPADADEFSASTSAPEAITIVPPTNPTDSQNVIVEVPVGTLTISVGGDESVTLNPVINAAGSRFTDSATMDDVTVLDQRAGSKGWTVNGQLGVFDYVSGALPAGATVVSNTDIGWTPAVRSVTGTQVVNASLPVAPGGLGLSVSTPLAVSPQGSSTGTAVVGGDIAIDAPTTIAPGTHTAILTFTAI